MWPATSSTPTITCEQLIELHPVAAHGRAYLKGKDDEGKEDEHGGDEDEIDSSYDMVREYFLGHYLFGTEHEKAKKLREPGKSKPCIGGLSLLLIS